MSKTSYDKWISNVDAKIDEWHTDPMIDVDLPTYLGMTQDEYDTFVTQPRVVFKKLLSAGKLN